MGEKIIPPDGRWIAETIKNKILKLVCDGAYQMNPDTNRVFTAWVVN